MPFFKAKSLFSNTVSDAARKQEEKNDRNVKCFFTGDARGSVRVSAFT